VGVTPELWSTMAELGWLGVLVPESAGGLGLGLVDLVVLQEELGASCPFPVPSSPRRSLATLAAVRLGADELLADLASGPARHGGGRGARPRRPPRTVKARATRHRRSGGSSSRGPSRSSSTGPRPTGPWSWPTTTDALATFLLEAPAGEPVPALDVTRKVARSTLDGRTARRVGPAGDQTGDVARILDDLNVAVCAELVGTAERALSLAVEYAKVRVQFDRPIATFQVIKHKAADMLHHLELARVGTHYAAWASDADDPERERAAAMCKGFVAEAADFVTAECIQVHGGVGFTWDVDCHLLYRRAKQDDLLFGAQGYQRERLADLQGGGLGPSTGNRFR
jgi:alkylation response protein AidB-like acyl-CoA dehydrogenase